MNSAHAFGHQLGLPFIANVTATVFIVDDDVRVRDLLEVLIRCEGLPGRDTSVDPRIFRSENGLAWLKSQG